MPTIAYPERSVRRETLHTLSYVRPALRPGDTLVDIGCGGGFVLAELAGEHEGMGLDIVDLRQTDLPRFALYDGVTLPCADASFDVALLTFVLHHVPDERKGPLVREAARIARRRIVVLEDTPRNAVDRYFCNLHGEAHRRRIGSTAGFGFFDQPRWEAFFVELGLTVASSTVVPRLSRDLLRPWARTCFVIDKPAA